jgi:hypothetical protein
VFGNYRAPLIFYRKLFVIAFDEADAIRLANDGVGFDSLKSGEMALKKLKSWLPGFWWNRIRLFKVPPMHLDEKDREI